MTRGGRDTSPEEVLHQTKRTPFHPHLQQVDLIPIDPSCLSAANNNHSQVQQLTKHEQPDDK